MRSDQPVTVRFLRAVPQFTVPDVVQAAEYYRDVLGFQIASYWDGERASLAVDPPPYFAIVYRDQVQVFFGRGPSAMPPLDPHDGGYHAYFHVSGVEALAAELRARGATIIDGPDDRSYGQREVVVQDCNGRILAFGEDLSARPT